MTIKQKVDKAFLKDAPADKVANGQHNIESIEANIGQFPSLPFSPGAMQTANTALSTAIAAAKSGDHNDIAQRNNLEKTWNNIWSKTADYVSFVADGNVDIITKAGFTPTSGESVPKGKPGQAVIKTLVTHDGGVAEIELEHPGAGVAAAYMYLAIPADAQVSTAADGTITITLAGGQKLYAKCDTHNATTMGGMVAGQALKLIAQPVNRAGAGGTSTPKGFSPQP